MSEVSDKPSQIQNKDLAWEVAHAEKPGRDYLHDNPLLPRDKMIEIATEIGAASMHATLKELDKRNPYAEDSYTDRPVQIGMYNTFHYTSFPKQEKQLNLVESPLVAEWAKLPGMKLINGRPVVNKQDMTAFAVRQKEEGKANYNKGMGSEVWNRLSRAKWDAEDMEYVPEHPLYAIRELSNKLQYFDRKTSEEAGLELVEESLFQEEKEYVDLFSLYEVGAHLQEAINQIPKRKPDEYRRFSTHHLSEGKAKFLSEFLKDMLHSDS